MASFNSVILMGNLTRDPQLKYLPSQMAVTEFGLAVNRKFKTAQGEEREEVLYVDCTAFGKTGELINQYFDKGKPIFVAGRLKYDSWEDKNGGGKRSKLTVVVDNFQFIGGRDGTAGDDTDQRPAPQQRRQGGGGQRESFNTPPRQRPQSGGKSMEDAPGYEEPQFSDDDIPF